jgi:hypothetical protein
LRGSRDGVNVSGLLLRHPSASTRTRSVLTSRLGLSRDARGDQKPEPVFRILDATPDLLPGPPLPSRAFRPLGIEALNPASSQETHRSAAPDLPSLPDGRFLVRL